MHSSSTEQSFGVHVSLSYVSLYISVSFLLLSSVPSVDVALFKIHGLMDILFSSFCYYNDTLNMCIHVLVGMCIFFSFLVIIWDRQGMAEVSSNCQDSAF